MKDVKKNKDLMNPEFFGEVERFKRMVHCNIGPKKSCNEGEYVNGEGNSSNFLLCLETRKVLLAGWQI